MKNIVLIGFMGSGKTTVGRILADQLGMPFHDTDRLIEEKAGMDIGRIFEESGEDHFRRLEKDAVKDVAARGGRIIATGGGVVLDEENVSHLKKEGFLVYLEVSARDSCRRVEGEADRPLLDSPDPESAAERLLCARTAVYESVADLSVKTSEVGPDRVAAEIVGVLRDRGEVA